MMVPEAVSTGAIMIIKTTHTSLINPANKHQEIMSMKRLELKTENGLKSEA